MRSAFAGVRNTCAVDVCSSWSWGCAHAACAAIAFCLLAGGLRAQNKPRHPVVICEGPQALADSNQQSRANKPATPDSVTLEHRPSATVQSPAGAQLATPAANETIPLTVPQGTPIQVVLDKEIRVRKVGQPIQGRVAQAIYSFDKLVIPANSTVIGKITRIRGVSTGRRAEAALNADFTPAPNVDMEFSELLLPDGKQIPIRTKVTPGSGQVIQFVSAAGDQKKGLSGEISKKKKEAESQAHSEWNAAIAQVKAPGKLHRIGRYLLAEMPFHPHYISAGTVYFAELESALNFGSEPLTTALAESIAHPKLPDGSVVQARLLTPLNSATTHRSDPVVAMVSKPLFDGKRLVIPEGSLLKGTVLQVSPARRMAHNGQLRPVFHQLTLPDGIEQQVEASLAAVQAGKAQNLKLDAEGGARATSPKSRYLDTAIAVGLAAVSQGDDVINQGEGGAGGFRLLGFALGLAVRSQPLGMAMGAFGGGKSIYTHFFATGSNVVLPKYTAMDITIGTNTHRMSSAAAIGRALDPSAADPPATHTER